MSRTQFIRTEAVRPFYATLGATDAVVEHVRGYVVGAQHRLVDVQKDVSGRLADAQRSVTAIDVKPSVLREQAVSAFGDRVDALARDAKARRSAVEARVLGLPAEAKTLPGRVQAVVDENVATVNGAYADLTRRGEALVARIRSQESTQEAVKAARTTVAKAKTTRTQAAKAAKATEAEVKAAVSSTSAKAGSAAASARTATRRTTATARKQTAAARSSAKATTTSAKKAASEAARAAAEAAEQLGD